MSNPKFHTLTVKDVCRETDDCVSVAFDIPSDLKEEYRFRAGQYITIKHQDKGEELRRSYSLCSSPLEDDYRVAIKKVDKGIFSTYANDILKKGDTLEVMTPDGHFTTEISDEHSGKYLAFVAGSGITPVLSLLKNILEVEKQSSFILVYGNRNVHSIIFKEELESLKNKYPERLQIIYVLSREKVECDINNGRIDKEKCISLFEHLLSFETIDKVFLCGPEEMILDVKEFMLEKGMNKSKVKFELFNTSFKARKDVNIDTGMDSQNMCDVTIKVDERSFDFKLPYGGQSILDAALANGADLPFACKGGVCCTCRAQVLEGEVRMDVNYALEDDEVEQGFVLTCQSHPKSSRVVIDFDVR